MIFQLFSGAIPFGSELYTVVAPNGSQQKPSSRNWHVHSCDIATPATFRTRKPETVEVNGSSNLLRKGLNGFSRAGDLAAPYVEDLAKALKDEDWFLGWTAVSFSRWMLEDQTYFKYYSTVYHPSYWKNHEESNFYNATFISTY